MTRVTSIRLLFLAIACVAASEPGVTETSSPAKAETPGQRVFWGFPAEYDASVLAGIDTLGRILIATDSDEDGLADIYFLATAQDRLTGPWSWHIPDAIVKYHNFTLTIESKARDYAVNIALANRNPREFDQSPFVSVLTNYELIEFVPWVATVKPGKPIQEIKHSDISTWPQNYRSDLLGGS